MKNIKIETQNNILKHLKKSYLHLNTTILKVTQRQHKYILFRIIKYFLLAKLSYNVPGIRRFDCPDKGLRSKTRAGKMWWSKIVQRAKPEHGFAEPEPPNRRWSVYRLLDEVWAFYE